MPFYSSEIIQQLKAQTDIAAVIESFLPLKRAGNGRYLGVCPFHDDRSPSMNVNPSLGIYKCFACGAAGDVFKFVREHEKMDFKAAVEWVAHFSNFTLPKLGAPENNEVVEEREKVRRLNELACQWFEQQLTMSEKAMAYLNSRRINEETRKRFHFGYAPDGREGFISYAVKNGFSPRDCVTAGLAIEKENGGISDKFRDRLMIAIQNLSGMIVAFGGRDLSGTSKAKYMNSPESALYHKSDILFGLNHSRQSIAKENSVIIVEGYFDMISLFQGGVTNVVAASGTALTEIHANILSRYAKTAYLVFDGDAAGQKATLRSLEIVLPKGIAPRVFALSRPDGTKIDPDNFINEQGPDAFRNALNQAEDWLFYLARQRNLQSPEARAEFVSYAKSLVKSIGNSELQNQYLKLISERYNTDRSLAHVKALKQERRVAPAQGGVPQAPQETIPWHAISPIEIRFANLLLKNPCLLERALEYFDMEWASSGIRMFESGIVEEFVNSIVAIYAETGNTTPQYFYENFTKELQLFAEGLPEEEWKTPQEIYEFYQTLTVLSTKLCDRQKKALPLDTMERVNTRMQMTKFTQGMITINNLLNAEKIQIDAFADQVIKSKAQLIQFQAALPLDPYTRPSEPSQGMVPSENFAPPEDFAAEAIGEEPPDNLPEPPDDMPEPPESLSEPPDEEEYSYDPDEFSNDDDMGF